MACGLPGKMSKVGLGTFIDPRVEGGKMNERTRSEPDISEIVEYHGEEYLMYNEVPIDTLLIRGTTCDEMGNMNPELTYSLPRYQTAAPGADIMLDGREVSGLSERDLTMYRRYDIGFVFQFYNLVQNLTALENVELASQICRDPLPAASVLDQVGLAGRMG